MHKVLVLYYSRHGSVKHLAYQIAKGIEAEGCEAVLRTVPEVSDGIDYSASNTPESGDPYVSNVDLAECKGLALGSPTRFGNMAAPLKYFLDGTSQEWLSGALIDKPACVFTSSSSLHGGQESTLLSMLIPLMHHGMLIAGLPYNQAALHKTVSGGSPYGVTHWAKDNQTQLSDDESQLAQAQGRRLAKLVNSLF